MMFAIKAEVGNSWPETFAFSAQKTMYGGKRIAKGDTIFVFASENERGPGLIASGVDTSAKASAKKREIARQTPRVSITIRGTALAKRCLGRSELRLLSLPASQMKRRRSSAGSSNAADFAIRRSPIGRLVSAGRDCRRERRSPPALPQVREFRVESAIARELWRPDRLGFCSHSFLRF